MALTFMDAGDGERTWLFMDGSDYHTYFGIFTDYTGANPSVPPLTIVGFEGFYYDYDYAANTFAMLPIGATTTLYSTLNFEIGELIAKDSFSVHESGALTDAVEGNNLAELRFEGYHTADYYLGAVIRAIVDATPGVDDMPTRLEFATSQDGESTPTIAIAVDSNQKTTFYDDLIIGTTRLFSVVTTLSTAEINAVKATPIALVAAQGANTIIELVSAMITYDYATAAFTVGADEDLVIEYADGTDTTASIETAGFLDQADDEVRFYPSSLAAGTDLEASINQGLQIFNTGSGETTDGGGEVDVRVTYRVYSTGF